MASPLSGVRWLQLWASPADRRASCAQYDALRITTEVNGVVRQRSSTPNWCSRCPRSSPFVSTFLTLEAATSIPHRHSRRNGRGRRAVSHARAMLIKVPVENIGTLTNTIAEAAS